MVGCLTSQQHASVSQGRVCSDNCTCCHTEIEVADQTFHLTQSQYTDTGPTSPSTDPITPGAWQGSHWYQCLSHWYDSTPKKTRLKRDSNPGPSALEADALTTRPTRRLGDGRVRCAKSRDVSFRFQQGVFSFFCFVAFCFVSFSKRSVYVSRTESKNIFDMQNKYMNAS